MIWWATLDHQPLTSTTLSRTTTLRHTILQTFSARFEAVSFTCPLCSWWIALTRALSIPLLSGWSHQIQMIAQRFIKYLTLKVSDGLNAAVEPVLPYSKATGDRRIVCSPTMPKWLMFRGATALLQGCSFWLTWKFHLVFTEFGWMKCGAWYGRVTWNWPINDAQHDPERTNSRRYSKPTSNYTHYTFLVFYSYIRSFHPKTTCSPFTKT